MYGYRPYQRADISKRREFSSYDGYKANTPKKSHLMFQSHLLPTIVAIDSPTTVDQQGSNCDKNHFLVGVEMIKTLVRFVHRMGFVHFVHFEDRLQPAGPLPLPIYHLAFPQEYTFFLPGQNLQQISISLLEEAFKLGRFTLSWPHQL